MDCPICMDKITENNKKTLSCGHSLHNKCFIDYIFHRKNQFIECPLCKTINVNTERFSTNPKKNIETICKHNKRCRHRTKKGTICKRKSKLLNYGYCYQHNKECLTEDSYQIMDDYISLLLCQRYNFLSRLYFLDIGKKLLIKYRKKGEKISCIDILSKIFEYLSINNIYYVKDYNKVYIYFKLKKPEKYWIESCIESKCIY